MDPNQLRDVSEFTGLRTFVNARVDVEKPEFESEAFRLFIFRNLEIQENLRLTNVEIPIHLRCVQTTNCFFSILFSYDFCVSVFRYHRPRETTELEDKKGEQPIAVVKMQNPRLFLACEGEDLAAKCPDRVATLYCDSTGTTKCEYLHIPYKVVSSPFYFLTFSNSAGFFSQRPPYFFSYLI